MGNLRAYLPITFITFAIGWLCIAAVPPLSGFWAKGDVLDNTWAAHPALWVVGIVTAALTAYYMSRLTGLAFFGKDRWADAGDDGRHPRRGPRPPRRRSLLGAPRVAVDHDRAPVDPGVLRGRGRRDGHLGQPVLPGQLGGPGVRRDPVPEQPLDDRRVGPGHRRRPGGHRLRAHRPAPVVDPVGPAGPGGRLPAGGLVHQRALRRRVRAPERAVGRLLRRRRRPQGHRRRRQRRGRRLQGDRRRCCAAPRRATCATTCSGSCSGPWSCSASC